jgi:hypothetical protein
VTLIVRGSKSFPVNGDLNVKLDEAEILLLYLEDMHCLDDSLRNDSANRLKSVVKTDFLHAKIPAPISSLGIDVFTSSRM